MYVHWGTFTLNTPHWNALKYIEALLKTRPELPYDIYDPAQDGDFQIIGGGKNGAPVITTVVCVPLEPHSTWVSVIVTGTDSGLAEGERNSIREEIIELNLN